MHNPLQAIISRPSLIREEWLSPEMAVREVIAFKRHFGPKHLLLACHAALPWILSPELLNLIRINFLDNQNIPWVAEADFLLSSLCRPLGNDLFEVEPGIREVLLVELDNETNWKRPLELAEFLQVYLTKKPHWKMPPDMTRTQWWIARAYIDPDSVIEEMTEVLEKSLSSEEEHTFNLPGKIQVASALEIAADPLERANSRMAYQYLVNNSRVLAQVLYGEGLAIKQEALGSEVVEKEEGLLSPVILKWLIDVSGAPASLSAPVSEGEVSTDQSVTFQLGGPIRVGSTSYIERKADAEGDTPRITINDYVEIIQGKRMKPSKGDGGALNKIPSGTNELIGKNLKLERQGTTFFTGSESKIGVIRLPETEEEFSHWYYRLDDYEQNYVHAVAVLHGAPVHEVAKRANSLYKLTRNYVQKQEPSSLTGFHQGDQQETQQRDASGFSDMFLRRIPPSSRELRLRTFTITRRVDGVERLYWQDVDAYGLSTFGLHLLEFLCNEFIFRGEDGQNFLDLLRRWSEESNDEVSRKAAHSYGIVLWCHDTNLLGSIAEKWAKVNSFRSRHRTAELLDGAYEIESVKGGDNVRGKRTSSVVLWLLDDWIARVHSEFTAANANLGVAVASTYGLIGKRSPEIALAGLERLLQLPQSRSTEETHSIFAAGVSTYVILTWSGHVRNVLKHLASNAEHLSHQRALPLKTDERHQYRRQREVRLNATIEAFFLVAAASFTEVRNNYTQPYSLIEPLPPHPAIPDPYGRDVLLAGLLSQNEVEFKEHITTLLCVTIVEKKSEPAFDLLRCWANVVLEMRGVQDTEAEKIYLSFRQFIVNLGKTIERWCLDLEKQGLHSPQAIDLYKNRLEQWCIVDRYHSDPIASLAQEVLNQLGD